MDVGQKARRFWSGIDWLIPGDPDSRDQLWPFEVTLMSCLFAIVSCMLTIFQSMAYLYLYSSLSFGNPLRT